MAEPRVVSGAYRGQLVESPVWDAASDCLWFVDVLNCVGCCDVKTQNVRTWAIDNWCAGCESAQALR
jgi:sugar lactone lactonase YvrE